MKFLIIAVLAIAPAFADELSDARDRFDTVAASAAGWMHSVDSIEWRLNQDGLALHPEIVALRARIGAALNAAHQAIDRGELKNADRAMSAAEALIERLARKI